MIRTGAFPASLDLSPVSRHPLTLRPETVRTVLATPLPTGRGAGNVGRVPNQEAGPFVSIVIVTYDNLVFNRLCLETLVVNTDYSNYEVIVVDNGSTDGTVDYLEAMSSRHPQMRLVCNSANRGFAAAVNQGMAIARGEVLALLNNDTAVPPGWLARLVRHAINPEVGLVGPVTNRIGNEAQIEANYRTYGEFLRFAREQSRSSAGTCFDIRTAAMFCVAMRRPIVEQVGPLDERFGIGTLEDDDYAVRVRAAGYRVVCAEDVFVHHFDKASFGKLIPTGEYGEILRTNRQQFAEKWGSPWEPYRRRPSDAYRRIVDQIRDIVDDVIPPDARVVVVSKGDEDLLRLGGRHADHFPQAESGAYAGHYPANSAEAIAHLEALRRKGAEYLLFPQPAFWWLDHYAELRAHLEQHCRLIHRADGVCLIFALERGTDDGFRASHDCATTRSTGDLVPSCAVAVRRRTSQTEEAGDGPVG